MSTRYTVKRGDNLWSLAFQCQGSGTQYPKILEHHNREVARRGPNSKLLPIRNENLIYIGQTLFLPPRPRHVVQQGAGKKHEASQPAVPVDLKIKYSIGRDTPPVVYTHIYGDYTIKTELSGEITIEMKSEDRYKHNLELCLSKDSLSLKQKLHKDYDPVLKSILKEPEMVYEQSQVKIKAPIAAEAKLGQYTIRVDTIRPMKMTGSIKPPSISDTIEEHGREYKYTADIEFKVEVNWHPKDYLKKEPVTEPVVKKAPQRKAIVDTDSSNDNVKTIVFITLLLMPGIIITGAILGSCSPAMAGSPERTKQVNHTVDFSK